MERSVCALVALCLIIAAVPTAAQAPYCSAGGTAYNCATPDEFIMNVSLGAFSNGSACYAPPGYTDFTALTGCNVNPAGTSITVTVGEWFSASDTVTVFVDWNANLVLNDAGEAYPLVQGPTGQNVNYTGTITPPLGAVSPTRMRICLQYAQTANPCFTGTFGEAEDYTANVSTDCLLVFSSPNGSGSLQIDNTNCPASAGLDYQIGVTFVPGAFPMGWFFGLDISLGDLLGQHSAGFQNILWGTLNATGASAFGPLPANTLPVGLQIWAVTTEWGAGFSSTAGARAPITYTIP